jgi:hypothetical protein
MNNMEDLHFRSVVLRFSVQNILDRTDDAVAIACDKEFSMGGGLGRAFLNRGNTAQLTVILIRYIGLFSTLERYPAIAKFDS